MGITGYFISIIISNIICNIFLIFRLKLWEYLIFGKCDIYLVKEMLIYSIPLIPNALMWWVMNASDRYIIAINLGVAANGLYAVANKIPTILSLLYSIFNQAWQLSAIEEADKKNKAEFYTSVFNIFSILMLIATSIILVCIKPVIQNFLSSEFSDSWKYVPFLLLAVVFTSFSSFLGMNYIAMKKTKGIFKTSLIGAMTNIILNLIMIPKIGLNGAAIATMISFFGVWIIRIYDTREFVLIKFNIKKLGLTIIIIFIQIIMLYTNLKLIFIFELVLLTLICLLNIDILNVIYIKSAKKLLNRIG